MSRLLLAALIAGTAVTSLPAAATTTVHPVFMAAVNSDGTKARSTPATITTSRSSAGVYNVIFPQNVSGCEYQLTGGNPATGTPAVIIVSAAGLNGNPKGLFISNTNLAGANTDSSFYVVVSCP